MTTSPSRLALLLLLLLVSFTALDLAAARPGFLFTRNRGRCTPQFWSSRREAWPRTVPHASTVGKVFGSMAYERFRPELTVLESTERNDDGGDAFVRLVKQGSAALLNSYAREGFPYKAWEVKTLVIQGLVSPAAAAEQAEQFAAANEACN